MGCVGVLSVCNGRNTFLSQSMSLSIDKFGRFSSLFLGLFASPPPPVSRFIFLRFCLRSRDSDRTREGVTCVRCRPPASSWAFVAFSKRSNSSAVCRSSSLSSTAANSHLSVIPASNNRQPKDQVSSVSDARNESEAYDRMTVPQWRVLLRDDKPGAPRRTKNLCHSCLWHTSLDLRWKSAPAQCWGWTMKRRCSQ